ncbi:hypothetical protein B0H10DRAFT_2062526 [Mycena sp. CBHHK59/15]|nr:hypothetical protein B0H10DRAFT_2062526 [Mycena sp. CBHHK59/15]
MDDLRPVIYGLAVLLAVYVFRKRFYRSTIDSVPTIGSPGAISSYRDAFRFFLHGEAMVKQGYDRYTGHIYRIPFMGRWNYVVSGADLIKDIGYTPEDKLSFDEAIRDQIQSDLTMGPELRQDPHLIPAVLTCLTRNLGRCFPGVRDEVVCAFDDILALEGTGLSELQSFRCC